MSLANQHNPEGAPMLGFDTLGESPTGHVPPEGWAQLDPTQSDPWTPVSTGSNPWT